MKRSFKVKLHPNNVQATKMFQMADAARYAYNWAIDKQMNQENLCLKYKNDNELRADFTKLKKKNKWLYKISNNVMKQSIKDCCKAFDRYIDIQSKIKCPYTKKKLKYLKKKNKEPTNYDKKGHPKFKVKKHAKVHFYQDPVKIKFTSTHVKLEKITESKRKNRQRLNWIRLGEKNRIPLDVKYENPRITYDGESWWISVTCEIEEKIIHLEKSIGIGCDLGIKKLAVCSDGSKARNINKTRKMKKIEKRKKRIQRKISRKYEMNKNGEQYIKTNNIIKYERKQLLVNHRLTNIRINYIHHITNKIIQKNPKFICIEDLNIIGMMSNKHLAKFIQDQKWDEFRRQIEYKSETNNIKVIYADRFFPSSKTCVKCGKIKEDLKLKDRMFKCSCGNLIDRDFQAAFNLYKYGLEHLNNI